jgi:hypothetical protein
MSQPEAILQAEIRRALGAGARHARLFRNMSGLYWAGHLADRKANIVVLEQAQQVQCGLVTGAGDLVGWTTVEITPDMVGQKIAVFTSGEIKRLAGKDATAKQDTWRENIIAAGGRAAVIKTPQQALALVAPGPWSPPAAQADLKPRTRAV